jgi:hypothetical protein
MGRLAIDLVGKQFGSLRVVSREPGTHEAIWKCICEICGVTKTAAGGALRRGVSKCICQGGAIRHGMSELPTYIVWVQMRSRCANPRSKAYPRYGGRGITVCAEWMHDFPAFNEWARANGYVHGLEIDRIDNDAGYSPENCRFVTPKKNCRNKSNNFSIEFQGETRLLVEWSERLSIPMKVLHNRIRTYGWSTDRALSTPHMTVAQAAKSRRGRT